MTDEGGVWDVARLRALLLECALQAEDASDEIVDPGEVPRETFMVQMRDGIRLATDLYGRVEDGPARPTIILRTPYDRQNPKIVRTCSQLADRGYAALAQDCRGTGDSEPDAWDYYVREPEDGYDLVEWVLAQSWCDGFVGACGSSYSAQVQWCMATHPRMGAIVPEVSGLGFHRSTNHLHMFLNAYARSVGKGADKVPIGFDELERQMIEETLATGFFQAPLQPQLPASLLQAYPRLMELAPAAAREALWQIYVKATCEERTAFLKLATGSDQIGIVEMEALPSVFGQNIAHDAHTLPAMSEEALVQSLHAPALLVTGWYDWGLPDALATFEALQRHPHHSAACASRLIVTPSAHNMPGYHEGAADLPALRSTYRTSQLLPLIDAWHRAVAAGEIDRWPRIVYYLQGADEWIEAEAWPPPETGLQPLFLGDAGDLQLDPPTVANRSDSYVYCPNSPTPTVGGSIVSYVYPPGSVDVAAVQERDDVLVYTSGPLRKVLDLVGPLRAIIYASSSAVDTDFAVRFSIVHEDGRAIQIQNGDLRTRYRDSLTSPSLLEPGKIYRFGIDMWSSGVRVLPGQRLRIDISSADFPRFDRHANRIDAGPPLDAEQRIFRSPEHPSHVLLPVFANSLADALS